MALRSVITLGGMRLVGPRSAAIAQDAGVMVPSDPS